MTRRALRGIESSVLSQGATGVLSSLGVAFPGFGLILGVLLSRIFEDEPPSGATIEWFDRFKRAGDALKAKDYATADAALANLEVFRQATQGFHPGVEKLYFIARIGHALTSGNRSGALAFARYIDSAQNEWDQWASNVDSQIAYIAAQTPPRVIDDDVGSE